MVLPLGKVPIDVLKGTVLKCVGYRRDDVVQGPGVGEDAAILRVGDMLLVTHSDPITGAVERIGWLAVNVNANDVATRGARPRWFLSSILLPESSEEEVVSKICKQIHKAALDLGVAVVGGHSEVTPGLNHPVVVGCMMGLAEDGRYVTTHDVKPGSAIILTKGAGVEGTAILASDRSDVLEKRFSGRFLQRARIYFRRISVVKDAMTAFSVGGVFSMHDPTEGGVAGGLHEMADASGTGFRVESERILVSPITQRICEFFEIDPLQLIGSGALLISADKTLAEEIVRALSCERIEASIIGEFTSKPRERVIGSKAGVKPLPRPISDHLWIALSRDKTWSSLSKAGSTSSVREG